MTELKPCPRCKSKNVFWRDGAYHNFKIKCENCGLETPECNLDGAIQFETYEGARDWWNHRHESDELPEWFVDAVNERINELQAHCDMFRDIPSENDTIVHATFLIRELYGLLSIRKQEENK